MKYQNLVKEIIDIKGSCIGFENMKYKPLRANQKRRLVSINNELKEKEEKNSNDWKELIANMKEMEKMEIQNYKEINKGCLIGRFDVKISECGLTIRGCSYFEKEGKRWIGMPGERYQSKDGRQRTLTILFLIKLCEDDLMPLASIKSNQGIIKQSKSSLRINCRSRIKLIQVT